MQEEQWVLTPAVKPGTSFRSLSLSGPAPAQSAADQGGRRKWGQWGSAAAPVRTSSPWPRPGQRGGTAKCTKKKINRILTLWRLCPPATTNNITKTLGAHPRIAPAPARVSMTPVIPGTTTEPTVILPPSVVTGEHHQSSQCNKIYLKAVYCIEYCFYQVDFKLSCTIHDVPSDKILVFQTFYQNKTKEEGKLQAPPHTKHTILISELTHYILRTLFLLLLYHNVNLS